MLRVDANKKTKQSGFIVSVELMLIAVIMVVGLTTGMTKLRDQTIAELSDTGSAIGAMNQAYAVSGTVWTDGDLVVAETGGWTFDDAQDVATADEVGGDTQFVAYQGVAALTDPANEAPVGP
jgi:hypothetical protein